MKRILIISPYSGDITLHEAYLRLCIAHVISRGHAPFATHYIYPNFLNDSNPEQRKLGMEMGQAWGSMADEYWVFRDHGISSGMTDDMIYFKSAFPETTMKSVYLDKGGVNNES